MNEVSSSASGAKPKSALRRIDHWLDRVLQPVVNTCFAIGLAALTMMMFLTFTDVILRYLFNRPILGSFDLTEYLMAILVTFGAAYCAIKKGHIIVDIVISRFPPKPVFFINIVNTLLGIVFFGLVSWRSFVQMQLAFNSNITSSVLPIPVYPFIAVVAFGSLLFGLVLIKDLIMRISTYDAI